MAKICIAVVLVALGCVGVRLDRVPARHAAPELSAESPELLVIVNPGVTAVAAAALAARHALVLGDNWRILSLDRDCYVFSGSAAGIAAAHAALATDPDVESVQATRLFHVAAAREQVVDPYVNLQHSLISARIDEAHQLSTGAGVKVAIIDTGLDRTHYDLRGRVEAALNFVDADQTLEIVEFHATAVAGIIGAAANNGRGIVGIAPDARLYSLRACWESLPGTSRGQCSSFGLARALDWAITNEMKVVNVSLQGEFDPLVSRLISRATQRGLVVVAATDLGDEALSFPASMSEVIAVSYHDPLRTMDYTRNAGKIFIAPGEEILTTMPDNTYDFVSGSSFASAHVAGIVALLAEHVPDIDAHTVRAVLRSSIRIANWDVTIDACTALGTVTGSDNCRPPPP
ncbi:MAG: S8 family peptidase [Gammaproteobacteria bacterium]|jgi:subtilisin family serine protease